MIVNGTPDEISELLTPYVAYRIITHGVGDCNPPRTGAGMELIRMAQSKALEGIQNNYGKATTEAANQFGMALGLANFYAKTAEAAIAILKSYGCTHCNHLHCEGCKDMDKWGLKDGEKETSET